MSLRVLVTAMVCLLASGLPGSPAAAQTPAGAEDLAALERAVRLAPQSAEAHSALGRAYLLNRQAKPAVEHLGRAVELGASDARTLLHLGSALWETGRPAEAERAFRRVLDSGGATLIALQQLGHLLLFDGRAAEAVDLLRRASVLLSGDVDLQLHLARALEESGKAAEALAAYRRAVEMSPELARARYGLAQAMLRSGDRAGAARELETYRRLFAAEQERVRQQNVERARLDRGWELLRGGKPQEAAQVFTALGDNAEALSGLAFSRSAAGDHRGAVAALEKAVALAPDRADLRLALDEERMALNAAPNTKP